MCQVKAKELQELKHKLAWNCDQRMHSSRQQAWTPAAYPREELHQFLLGLYGEYILPATLYAYTQALRDPALFKTPDSPLVTEAMPPQGSFEFIGRLFNYGGSNSSICNALHQHVCWQAYREAHDWRQDKNITSVIALSTQRPHHSGGIHPFSLSVSIICLLAYDIVSNITSDIGYHII